MRFFIVIFLLLFSCPVFASNAYDKIQIIVNDHVITQNEIEIRLSNYIKQSRQTAISREQMQKLRSQMINLLIEEALLDVRADELNIVLTDEQLDAEVEHYRKQNRLSQIEFEELLDRRQLTLANFRKQYLTRTRRSIVVNQEIRSQINVTDEELKRMYEKGEGKTVRVRARHILLILKQNASPDEILLMKQRILEIKRQIEQGKSFTEMADQYSQDPSVRQNHGDLGYFKRNDMVQDFAEAAFSLQPGVISDPVRTPFGFHLIEVVDRKEDPLEDFEKVKQKLHQQVYQREFEIKYKEYIQNLKQKARIILRKEL